MTVINPGLRTLINDIHCPGHAGLGQFKGPCRTDATIQDWRRVEHLMPSHCVGHYSFVGLILAECFRFTFSPKALLLAGRT